MSNDIIQAEYDKLEDIAGRFAANAEATVDMRSRIESAVHALQNGNWEGEGSAAFFAEMNQDVFPVITRLTTALEQAQSVTLQTKAILQAAEEEAASSFREADDKSSVETNTQDKETSSDQQNLKELEDEYYQIDNQMKQDNQDIHDLSEELEKERQEMIDRGLGEIIDLIETMIDMGKTPSLSDLAGLVGESFDALMYAKDAIAWGLKNMKYVDMQIAFNASQGAKYDQLGQIMEQIRQFDPNWQPPNIYSD